MTFYAVEQLVLLFVQHRELFFESAEAGLNIFELLRALLQFPLATLVLIEKLASVLVLSLELLDKASHFLALGVELVLHV